MARSWLIDSRGLAKKVINAGLPAACQIKDCGANTQCPNCHHLIDNSDNSHEWPGLPAGVKFDPSDVQLLDHLAAKQGVGRSNPHLFIDEFIPTLEGEGGICYTHPENLPGSKRDGSSVHFFHRITNAYASGRRKRRRIQDQESAINSRVRWHKTGKTKPVVENGIHKGFKKIMVLYETSKRGSKPDKCNWVQHQYHLGSDEDDKEGEFVVSKIFYQPEKETVKDEQPTLVMEESDVKAVPVIPMTPKTNTPDPPRQDQTPYSDCFSEDHLLQPLLEEHPTLTKEESHVKAVPVIPMTPKTNTPDLPHQDQTPYSDCFVEDYFLPSLFEEHPTLVKEESHVKAVPVIPMTPKTNTPNPPHQDQTPRSDCFSENYLLQSFLEQTQQHLKEPYHASYEFTTGLGANTEAVDLSRDDSLFCNEIIGPYDVYGDLRLENPCASQVKSDINAVHERDTSGFGELDNLELDTPPDFNDLQFASQDSVFDWMER